MRIGVVISDGHTTDVDPRSALAQDLGLVQAVRDHLDGIVYHDGWLTGPRWNLAALSVGAFLGPTSGALELTIRSLALGVRNPVELAEQLANLDHAWHGRFRASLSVGTPAQCAAFGLDPDQAASRLEDGLGVVRDMWTKPTMAGAGPNYVFGEIRPTMRPVRPEGPPLGLAVANANDAAAAERLGLGAHVHHGDGAWEQLLTADGDRETSVELEFSAVTADELGRLSAAGVRQVDVRLREPGDEPAAVRARVEQLAERTHRWRSSPPVF
jgi:alkanesulfonate monooxygenase SsuD/methylene tetrahydromethanopterin reductase-like flavin-dependent oxidoreductase (luciferase family)